MNLTNYNQISVTDEVNRWNSANNLKHVDYEKSPLKINVDFVLKNLHLECYREQLVSFLGMYPILEGTTFLDTADYILYMHPYARIDDASDFVIRELLWINKHRKPGAEIIVLGKSANAEKLLNGFIKNITFWGDHFAEKLGKKFGLDIKERYFVYDDLYERLNIWPVDGCLQQCGFCRRTYMDIKFESISLDIIEENLNFLTRVAPETLRNISLRAENLTEYGIDIYGESKLDKLIDLLNSYKEIESIEFPIGLAIGELTNEALWSICNCTKKIPLMYLNLEAGSDRLLQLIGKKHNRNQALHVFKNIKEAHPETKIYSTVMIGLPTEEISDIWDLADLISKAKPHFVFAPFYGFAPRHSLAVYPQLNDGLREYHLELLIKFLKELLEEPLELEYYRIFKNKRSRQAIKAKKELEMDLKTTGLGSHYRTNCIFNK